MMFWRLLYIAAFVFFGTNASFANTPLTIDVNSIKRIGLVIEKIDYINTSGGKLAEGIMDTVAKNLSTTGLFDIEVSHGSIFDEPEVNTNMSSIELTDAIIAKYDNDTEAVLGGFLKRNGSNDLELKIKLWDILDQREIASKTYIVNDGNWKRIADVISDIIFKHFTGEISGHFDTKIVYIAESGTAQKRKKRMATIDYNGDNLMYITDGSNLVLTPIFSKHDKNEIVYLEYRNDKPHIFKMNLLTNHIEMVGRMSEMTYAPNFSSKGTNEIVFAGTDNGASNIYKLDFNEGLIRQLTYFDAISTAPSWSPDGEKIVFVSDKSGSRKLYIMDKDGRNIEAISGNGIYDKPTWSPDGKLIAFVKLEGSRFSVGVITPNGESERIITSAYLVEGIKWSPNGRYLMYSKQKSPYGKDSIPSIYTMDIFTGIEYRVPTPINQGATDPDWVKK